MPHPPASSSAPNGAASAGAEGKRATWRGLDHGSIMGAELVVGILVWSGIGYLIDRWLATDPWFLGIGALVGFAGGLYLIWLRSGRMEAEERARSTASRQVETDLDHEGPAQGGHSRQGGTGER